MNLMNVCTKILSKCFCNFLTQFSIINEFEFFNDDSFEIKLYKNDSLIENNKLKINEKFSNHQRKFVNEIRLLNDN